MITDFIKHFIPLFLLFAFSCDGMHQHGAHVHGVAQLSVAFHSNSDRSGMIEIQTPQVDLPKPELTENANTMFEFSDGSQCEIDFEDRQTIKSNEENHSDILVRYSFTCQQKPESLKANLSEVYSSVNQIHSTVLGESGQTTKTATRSHITIPF